MDASHEETRLAVVVMLTLFADSFRGGSHGPVLQDVERKPIRHVVPRELDDFAPIEDS